MAVRRRRHGRGAARALGEPSARGRRALSWGAGGRARGGRRPRGRPRRRERAARRARGDRRRSPATLSGGARGGRGCATGSPRGAALRRGRSRSARCTAGSRRCWSRGRARLRPRTSRPVRQADRLPPPPAQLVRTEVGRVGDVVDYRSSARPRAGSEVANERFRPIRPARPRRLDGLLFSARLPARVRRSCATSGRTRCRRGSVRGRGGCSPAAGSRAAAKVRRGTRGLAHVHARLRLVARRSCHRRATGSRPTRATRGRDARTRRSRPAWSRSPRPAGERRLPDLQRPLGVHRSPVVPLPERPTAVFVGMLEAYKNVDGMVTAWRRVASAMPDAQLILIGQGRRAQVVETLVRELPDRVEYHAELTARSRRRGARPLDRARAAVLAGRARPRDHRGVRARPRRGRDRRRRRPRPRDRRRRGPVDPARGTDALVDRLMRVLEDRELAERLGRAATSAPPPGIRPPRTSRPRRGGSSTARSPASPDDLGAARLRHAGRGRRSHGARPDRRRGRGARRALERVDVIADRVGRHDLPANVGFRTFASRTKAGRGVRFEAALARSLRPGRLQCSCTWCRPSSCSRRRSRSRSACRSCSGTRIGTPRARCASRRASPIACSASTGDILPLDSDKLRGIGHAIDVERFAPAARRDDGSARCASSRSAASHAGRVTARCSRAPARRGGRPRRDARDPWAGADGRRASLIAPSWRPSWRARRSSASG